MLFFFYGQDNFSIREAVQKERAVFLKSNPGGIIEIFNLEEEEELKSFGQILETKSLFTEKKIIFVKNSFFSGETAREMFGILKKYFQNPDKEITLVFYEIGSVVGLGKQDKNLFQFLSETADKSGELPSLKGAGLEKWALTKFNEAGLKIQKASLQKLLFFTSYSPEKTATEIAKLISYKNFASNDSRPGGVVDNSDIEKVVTPYAPINNFSLLDAIAGRAKIKSIALLEQFLSEGEDPQAILALMVYQFRVLLKVKSLTKRAVPYSSLAKLANLHPFVVKKTFNYAQKFEMEELKRAYFQLNKIDVLCKEGKIEISTALFQFLVNH